MTAGETLTHENVKAGASSEVHPNHDVQDNQAVRRVRNSITEGHSQLKVSEFPVVIETDRFFLRELTVDDVSARYLGWLSDSAAKKWIATADSTRELEDLREYVKHRVGREDVLFLGIFSKMDNLHIGNIKYEPVLRDEGSAELGILIGDLAFRGNRVFAEVLAASTGWLRHNLVIRRIYLGVERENLSAMNAYHKAGFVAEPSLQLAHAPNVLRMVLYV